MRRTDEELQDAAESYMFFLGMDDAENDEREFLDRLIAEMATLAPDESDAVEGEYLETSDLLSEDITMEDVLGQKPEEPPINIERYTIDGTPYVNMTQHDLNRFVMSVIETVQASQ